MLQPHQSDAVALFDAQPAVRASAVISGCGTYRYELARIWDDTTPPVLFVGMNPSTADAEQDDPTIRRCVRFARDWGYGGMLMGNLFAFRSTDPKKLPRLDDRPVISPIGEIVDGKQRNDEHLTSMAARAGLVVAAWGAITMPYGWGNRPEGVRDLLGHMHALALTKDGHPRHPLYVRADVCPSPMPAHVHDWGTWQMREQSLEVRRCKTCDAEQWD